MKLRVRLSVAFMGLVLSLLIVSIYEFAFEAGSISTVNVVLQDLRLAVLEYKAKKYSVRTWFKKAIAATPSKQSFPELQVFVIKRT